MRSSKSLHADTTLPDGTALDAWVDTQLLCAAGKREFRRGRYWTSTVTGSAEFRSGMETFRGLVARHLCTGYLAVVQPDRTLGPGAEQLRYLCELVTAAGYATDATALSRGEIVSLSFPVTCPVTGVKTEFEFFPVAFCPGHGNPDDPLYDPSLGTPFLAVNTTSDAFAFAMFVADTAERAFHAPPWAIDDPLAVDQLLSKCAAAWQKMSVSTLHGYQAISIRQSRAVQVAEDECTWLAPHRDPVFAEDVKETYRHEMPVVYAKRMCEKWYAVLFSGATYSPGRDGQAGGIPEIDAALDADDATG